MKTKLILWTMAATLAVLIALPILAGPNPKPAQPAAPAGQGLEQEFAKYPNYNDAVRHLQTAKGILEADHNGFGDHRVKAIERTKAAIWELNAAMAYAQQHGE